MACSFTFIMKTSMQCALPINYVSLVLVFRYKLQILCHFHTNLVQQSVHFTSFHLDSPVFTKTQTAQSFLVRFFYCEKHFCSGLFFAMLAHRQLCKFKSTMKISPTSYKSIGPTGDRICHLTTVTFNGLILLISLQKCL